MTIKPPRVKVEDDDNAEDAAALKVCHNHLCLTLLSPHCVYQAQIRALRRKLNQKRMRNAQAAVKKESSPIQAGQVDEDIIDLTED